MDQPHSSPEEARPVSDRRETPRWRALCGWVAVGLLIVLQYGLFRQYALREVVWAYPGAHDQAAYLTVTYDTYEHILDQGWKAGLKYGYALAPNGVVFHLQAALLFFLLGPGRLSALTVNFLYFALFQVVLAWTLRWSIRRWSVSFLGLGLLLTALSPFFWAGGIMDFRMDFSAMCLFGILLCLVVRSGLFHSRRWSLLVGAAAAFLILFRFITAVYLGGTLGLFVAYLTWKLWRRRRDPGARQMIGRHLAGIALASLVVALVTIPVLWDRREVIKAYYVVGHVTGAEKEIRRQEYGEQYDFYIHSLLADHAGPRFLGWGAAAVVAAILLGMGRTRAARVENAAGRRSRGRWLLPGGVLVTAATGAYLIASVGAKPQRGMVGLALIALAVAAWAVQLTVEKRREFAGRLDLGATFVFLASAFGIPLTALTLDAARSPIVGDVLLPVLLWLVLWTVVISVRLERRDEHRWFAECALATLAGAIFLMGCGLQLSRYAQRTVMTQRRDDVEQIVQLHDLIGQTCREWDWHQPIIANTTTHDYLAPQVSQVFAYERQGVFYRAQASLLSIFAVREADALKAVRASHFVIIAHVDMPFFPFDRSMEELIPKIVDCCEQNLVRLRSFRIFGGEVILYARTMIRTAGDSGGWITSDGLKLQARGPALRGGRIELRGKANWDWLDKVPAVQAMLSLPGQPPRALPATLTKQGDAYTIAIAMSPTDLPPESTADIQLTFDTYFVPKEIGLNEDTRRLVIHSPEDIRMFHGAVPERETDAPLAREDDSSSGPP